ncbi:hypothetical protein PCL1606_10500 [Pseudomonas chlororaphis]|uniref:Uncharacterized protein n=1 Tax=Pseudomonas chlororaphis TaxID=587753 RepID=A0A0D5XTT8_9PSED|nr:hypothetical protein PCL1606_10500 [Pseudomonas chlororaphis]
MGTHVVCSWIGQRSADMSPGAFLLVVLADRLVNGRSRRR